MMYGYGVVRSADCAGSEIMIGGVLDANERIFLLSKAVVFASGQNYIRRLPKVR